MRFFMLYSNQFATGNKPIGVASLAAMLKGAGHEFQLFDCTRYSVEARNKLDWNLAGAMNLAFKFPINPERLPPRPSVSYRGLVEELLRAIEAFAPDVVGLSALTDDYPLGLGLMREVKQAFPRLPTVAGGIHATVDPQGVIAEDCFDVVCVGEGEYVVLDIAQRIEEGRDFSGVANLWVKSGDGVVERNPVRDFEHDLDRLPFPDWSIFGETSFYKPFHGTVYKYGDFEMSRGCPYKCSYCINVQLQEIYKFAGPSNYHREKSIGRVIAEIREKRDAHGIEFLKFWDETFLLMSRERLEEFRDRYAREIGLPYVIETTAQSITEFSARVLRETNCKSVSLGLETGSPDIRKGLLHKPTDNRVYVKAFDLLERNDVNKVAFNMIGMPNESEEDVFRTIGINRLVGTHTQSVGIFYPYKGTPIRDMMVQNGWMDDDFELADLKDYDFNTFTAGNRSVVKFKDMDSRLLNRLWLLFSTYVYWPVALFPLVDYVKNNDDEFAVTLQNTLQRVTYFEKFGEWPPGGEGAGPAMAAEQEKNWPPLADARANHFVAQLARAWRGEGLERVRAMVADIAAGTLRPQYPIPEDTDALAAWLELEPADAETLRRTRTELRDLAKAGSRLYEAPAATG